MGMRSPTVPASTSTDDAGPGAGDVSARLEAARRRIRTAARRAGRRPGAVTLVAVTKGHGPDKARAALAAGQVDLGESRAQELASKRAAVGVGVRWHFVGRLQRNKVRDVVGAVSLIHSVDRLTLAERIAAEARRGGGVQRVLVQVNAGDDPAKAGCRLADAPRLVAAVRAMPGIACEGLMTIPPRDQDPRPVFARLRTLRDELRAEFPEVQHLSMGMSGDVEAAVEEGATIVRLGEALFGPRTTDA